MYLNRTIGALAAALTLAALLGCGSGPGNPGGTADVSLTGKIQEYVGDGHGGTKLWPSVLPKPGSDAAATMPFRLLYSLNPKPDRVVRKRISWYDLPKTKTSDLPGMPVVTLQPTADEDTDLFVFEGDAGDYYDGADILGFSDRYPTGDGQVTDGYVPDWVAFGAGRTRGYPTAEIAVYGYGDDPSPTMDYFIEADWAWELTVDGSSLQPGAQVQYGSDWNYFWATSGNDYTVHMTAHNGDPDLYVYEDASSEYVGGDATVGGGSVSFTAATTGWHFFRIYGYGPSNNDAEVWVTSP